MCAVGKAIDNSQSCIRGSGKCETMFVNLRANSREQRLWQTGSKVVYSVLSTIIVYMYIRLWRRASANWNYYVILN